MLNLFRKLVCKMLGKSLHLNQQQLMLYLCSNEALPNPLTASEESEYVIKMANGDENAKKELIERNLRLVVYIAKKFDNTGMEMEDLISVGAIGLIKAVNTFNYEKQIKLATYASRCIENEILMYLRKTSKQKKESSLDMPLSLDSEGNELLLADIIGVDEDEVFRNMENSFEKELIYKTIEKLQGREKEIMIMRFGLYGQKEKTQKEVATALKISQSYISRIEKKILDKMKKDIVKQM